MTRLTLTSYFSISSHNHCAFDCILFHTNANRHAKDGSAPCMFLIRYTFYGRAYIVWCEFIQIRPPVFGARDTFGHNGDNRIAFLNRARALGVSGTCSAYAHRLSATLCVRGANSSYITCASCVCVCVCDRFEREYPSLVNSRNQMMCDIYAGGNFEISRTQCPMPVSIAGNAAVRRFVWTTVRPMCASNTIHSILLLACPCQQQLMLNLADNPPPVARKYCQYCRHTADSLALPHPMPPPFAPSPVRTHTKV